jgi:hypothetical protein
MRRSKARITITLDRDLLKAARAAVHAGDAESLSSYVNLALAQKTEESRRRLAARKAIADYEAEFGVITKDEMELQRRLDRAAAIRVRAKRGRRKAG